MQKMKSFKKLITKSLIKSLGFTVITTIIAALVIYVSTFYKTIEEFNKASSDIVTNFFNNQISETTQDLMFLGDMILKSEEHIDLYMENFLEHYDTYETIWFADSLGIIKKIFPGNEYLNSTDKSGSDVYKDIVLKKKSNALSSVFQSTQTNLPSIDIGIPLNAGVLSTTISTTIFTNHIMKLHNNNNKFVALTDMNASWLSHPDSIKMKARETDPDFYKYSKLKSNESINIFVVEDGKYYYRYIKALNDSGWFFSIYHSITKIYMPVITLLIIIILISIPIIIISFSTSYRIIKKIFTPIDNFVYATNQIGMGDYHFELPSINYEEFNQLKLSLINMVENIDQREKEQKELWMQLLQSQKMEAIGSLASGVAHDFNNLLTAIGGYSDIISMNFEEDSKPMAYIIEVNKAIGRASALTKQLLAFSRKDSFEIEPLSVNSLINGIIKMLDRIVGEDINIEIDLKSDLPEIEADSHQFEQILLNLAINSRDALVEANIEKPIIKIETVGVVKDENEGKEYVKIIIWDNGPGIPESIKEHIFESFFTTKEKGKGTGLGLSTVLGIINQNEAKIEVGQSNMGGALFTILWPASTAEYSKDETKVNPNIKNISKKNIIYVDDEDILGEIAMEMLSRMNHNVGVASSGEEAFELIKKCDGKIDLLITDVIMPKIGGLELAKMVNDKWPHIKVLFVSGYIDDRIEKKGINVYSKNFLRKPFNTDDLKSALYDIFEEIS